MSIKSEVARIELAKADIKSAIEDKGGQASGKIDTFADAIRNLPSGKEQSWARPKDWCDVDDVYSKQYNSRKNCLVFGFDITDISNNTFSITLRGSGYNVMLHDAQGNAIWQSPKHYDNGAKCEEVIDIDYGCFVVYTDNEADISNVEYNAVTTEDGRSYVAMYNCIVELVGNQYVITNGLRSYNLVREKRSVDIAIPTYNIYMQCSRLRFLDISEWSIANIKTFNISYLFHGCVSLERIDISSWNMLDKTFTSLTTTFLQCYNLHTLILPSSINILAVDINLSQCEYLSALSMVDIFNKLPHASNTLTLGTNNLNKLTAEEKAIATSKGWTLA